MTDVKNSKDHYTFIDLPLIKITQLFPSIKMLSQEAFTSLSKAHIWEISKVLDPKNTRKR